LEIRKIGDIERVHVDLTIIAAEVVTMMHYSTC